VVNQVVALLNEKLAINSLISLSIDCCNCVFSSVSIFYPWATTKLLTTFSTLDTDAALTLVLSVVPIKEAVSINARLTSLILLLVFLVMLNMLIINSFLF
jgi:hypothetical protein